MKILWKDTLSAGLVVAAAVVTFAKLQSYSWWLIGDWKGALGVIASLGLVILLTNVPEIVELADIPAFFETILWLGAATFVIGSLFAVTTKAEFIGSGVLLGIAWMAQFGRHLWTVNHQGRHHLSAS